VENNVQLELARSHDANAKSLMTNKSEVYFILKRILDILIAIILLMAALPLIALISIIVFLDSPGPVIFSQERVGAKRISDGKTSHWKRAHFTCYKFRTMAVNADTSVHEELMDALIKGDKERINALQGQLTDPKKALNDDRLISSGKVLRKLSLDELPQLWNILRGDMSLVGPRPAIPYEVDKYSSWHLKRLEAQPGLTGLQQINARSADFEQQVLLDIDYIENQSLWLDIKIILLTPFAVFSSRGAY